MPLMPPSDYVYLFDIAALMLNGVLLAIFYLRRFYHTISGEIYKIMLWLNFVAASCDLATAFTNCDLSLIPLWLNYVINVGYILSHNLTSIVFLVYVISAIRGNIGNRPEKILWKSVVIVDTILILSTPLTGWVFSFKDGAYVHGPLMPILYGLVFLQILYAVYLFLRHRAKLSSFQLHANIFYIIFLAGTVLFQYIYDKVLLETFSTAVSFIMMNQALDNPTIYMYKNTFAFNQTAFDMTVKNRLNDTFAILDFEPEEVTFYQKTLSRETMDALNKKILNVCYKLFGHQAIYIRANHDFALFLEQDKVEETIKRIDEAFEEPLTVNDTDVRLTMNYCVLRHPGLTDSAAEINEVLRTTIMSMRHKSGQRIAEVKQALVDKNRREEQIVHLLRDALKNDGFAVYFQPILDVRTGRFRSAEALLRLKNTEIGYVGPDEFIPIAEQNGMILEIGETVFDKVCRFYAEKKLQEKGVEYVEVNLSMVQLLQADIAERLAAVLRRYDLSAERVNLEVTETASAGDNGLIEANVTRMVQSGFRFSLDDYGSGYAAASYLTSLPFSIVKIDRGIIWKAMKSPEAMAVLKHAVQLTRELDKLCVAEGVETREMAEMLKELGCDFLQGYLYSKPLSEKDILKFYESYDKI